MKRRNRDRVSINILLLLTSSFIFYSCSDITTPTDTKNNQAQEQKASAQKNATSVEEFFQRNNRHYFQLAELVPGFGGIYLEKKDLLL